MGISREANSPPSIAAPLKLDMKRSTVRSSLVHVTLQASLVHHVAANHAGGLSPRATRTLMAVEARMQQARHVVRIPKGHKNIETLDRLPLSCVRLLRAVLPLA